MRHHLEKMMVRTFSRRIRKLPRSTPGLRSTSLAACAAFWALLMLVVSSFPTRHHNLVPGGAGNVATSGTIERERHVVITEARALEQRHHDLTPDQEAARGGSQPTASRGPRPPENERERELARIPEYDPERDLIFYSHIHKTSGTSLSMLLGRLFRNEEVVPSSHPYKALSPEGLVGHNSSWWDPLQVMFSHDRPNVTDHIGLPDTKRPRLLLTVRNPLMHKASIYFESVCRFGLHIKDGVIDQEEATMARLESPGGSMFSFCRDPELWVGSTQFKRVYWNMQANWLSYGGAERHPCIEGQLELNVWRSRKRDNKSCHILEKKGLDEEVWKMYFERTADAAIRRLKDALWVGVTERMEEASCLLFLTLGKPYHEMKNYRYKEPRPITVWNQTSIDKVAAYDEADWRVFDAANEILDLRLWEARERLKNASTEERHRLGPCYSVLMRGKDPVVAAADSF